MPVTVVNFVRRVDAGGKFVLLRSRTDPDAGVLAFSDFTRDSQHRDIVDRWRSVLDAGGAGTDFRPSGGGWWKFDSNEGTLLLYGQSAAYGRYQREWLEDHLPRGPVMGETRLVMV